MARLELETVEQPENVQVSPTHDLRTLQPISWNSTHTWADPPWNRASPNQLIWRFWKTKHGTCHIMFCRVMEEDLLHGQWPRPLEASDSQDPLWSKPRICEDTHLHLLDADFHFQRDELSLEDKRHWENQVLRPTRLSSQLRGSLWKQEINWSEKGIHSVQRS